jgi:predicted nucleotidyltransferase
MIKSNKFSALFFSEKNEEHKSENSSTGKAHAMSQPGEVERHGNVEMNEIEDKVQTIAEKFEPEKVILFGSYAAGNPTSDSDVHLLIIVDTKRSTWDLAVEISSSLKHSFPMDILVRTPQEIATRLRYGDFFIQDIMERGKVLYERARH